MNETVLSFTVPNIVTVLIMVLVGFAALGVLAKLVQRKGKASA